MAYAVRTTITVEGDRKMFIRTAERHEDFASFMRAVGVLVMSSSLTRLTSVLAQNPAESAVRSGNLTASLRVGGSGQGGFGRPSVQSPHTVWHDSKDHVEVGSNLVYAATVHFGSPPGGIRPTSGKYLAIPIPTRLKRSGRWPRDLDPRREHLRFIPTKGGKAEAVLVDEEGTLGFGKGVLYALKQSVDIKARPYLFISDDDQRTIRDELYPIYLDERRAG
jgi:phage gpG-like protein